MNEPTQADLDRAHSVLFGKGPRIAADTDAGPYAISPLQIARLIADVRDETQQAERVARTLTAGRAD